MKEIVIASACRTAVGTFGGSLKNVPAAELGAIVVKEAVKRAGIAPEQVEEVLFGNVLQAGLGQAGEQHLAPLAAPEGQRFAGGGAAQQQHRDAGQREPDARKEQFGKDRCVLGDAEGGVAHLGHRDGAAPEQDAEEGEQNHADPAGKNLFLTGFSQ